MKFNEEYKIKAFIIINDEIYMDDSHYGASQQILNSLDFENEIYDEYELLEEIDKEVIFGGFYKINEKIYPIVLSYNLSQHQVEVIKKHFSTSYFLDKFDNICEINNQ